MVDSCELLTLQKLKDSYEFKDVLSGEDLFHLIGKHNPVIVEVGANCGQSTVTFLEQMPNAFVYCFEPDPRAIANFRKMISHPNVELIEAAVGSNNGTIIFNQSSGAEHINPNGWDHSGSIRKPKTHVEVWPWVEFKKQISVPIVRLDDWISEKNIPVIDFIWADVQGAESDLIEGAISTLRNTKYFYTEYSDMEWYEGQINYLDLTDLMLELGFEVVHKFQSDVLFINKKHFK